MAALSGLSRCVRFAPLQPLARAAAGHVRSLWKPAAMPAVEKGPVPLTIPRTNEQRQTFAFLQGSTTTATTPASSSSPSSPSTAPPATISLWHEVPYRSVAGKDTFSFVCEIPASSRAKMEMHKTTPGNPIIQDKIKSGQKKGEDRFYSLDMPWIYGFIPQTYEDPRHLDSYTHLKGDGDPIDVVVITPAVLKTGDVDTIKILGSLALVDEGETDWKIIAMLTSDARASSINSVADIPAIVDAIRVWFRDYKIGEGKGANKYAFDGAALGPAATIGVIEDTHFHWKELFKN